MVADPPTGNVDRHARLCGHFTQKWPNHL